jgi:hypothetical protein
MGYLYEACDQISVAEKNATKNILGRTEGKKKNSISYLQWSGGIKIQHRILKR